MKSVQLQSIRSPLMAVGLARTAPNFRKAAVAVFAVAFLPLLSIAPAYSNSLAERLKTGQSIRVGFVETDPYSFTKPDGTFTGSDVEILKFILKEMGTDKVEAIRTTFGSLIPALKADRIDIVASGMFMNPDRCKQVAFSEPIFVLGAALIVKKGNPKKIHSLMDIAKNPDIKVGHVVGAGGYAAQLSKAGVRPEQIVTLNDTPSLFHAIKADRIDAEMETTLTVSWNLQIANDPGLERAWPFEQLVVNGKPVVAVGAFAFRQTDTEFLTEFNKRLLALMKTPKYLEILSTFRFTEENVPVNLTAAAICSD